MENKDMAIGFELPTKKLGGFISYLKEKLPNNVIFISDFTNNGFKGADLMNHDKTKIETCVAIYNCDIEQKKVYIQMNLCDENVEFVESMGFQDPRKIKLFQIREW